MSAPASVTVADEREVVSVHLLTDPPGRSAYPGSPRLNIAIHVGRAVYMSCSRGGQKHRGLGVHGDVDIIPPGTPSLWEPDDVDTALVLRLDSALIESVGEDFGLYPDRIEFCNRFQIRDPQIENIGWALKSEMEAGFPNGKVFLDSLGTALAACALRKHSSFLEKRITRGGFSTRKLKQMLAFIEDNLDQRLTLAEIAAIAGVSASQCKLIFRTAMGIPVYRYVIQRRVERAKWLLCERDVDISQAALEAGFTHQSHLARHMKQVLGYTPGELLRELGSSHHRAGQPM
jgi:AraC family transcriptional regulator